MPAYITYMEVSMNSEGTNPSDLAETLRKLGWQPVYGRYDFAYKWNENWSNMNNHDYFDYMNKVHKVLSGHRVNYSLRTFESGKENFWVKWSE